jgi:OOP family OmpA-OmpF porin
MFTLTTCLRSFLPLVAIAVLGFAPRVMAQEEENESGPYVGGGFGEFDLTIKNIEGLTDAIQDLDTDDSAYKLFFGWRFNRFFSLEGDYIDLGNPRGNFDAAGTSGDYTLELSGFAGYAIGTLPIGIFELSGKIGYYFHDLEINVDLDNIGPGNGDVIGSDDSGEAVVYGVGAGVTLFDSLNAKLEYELFDLDELDDAYALWLTGAWRF